VTGEAQALREATVEVVATFEGRFVYRVRCSYHGTVFASVGYDGVEAARIEHLIEHDLELGAQP
jgi:hypothetical protein